MSASSPSPSPSSSSPSTSSASPQPPPGCPMHKKDSSSSSSPSFPLPRAAASEPPDVPDKPLPHVAGGGQGSACHTARVEVGDSANPLEMIPDASIPAAGRGNSEDGQKWLNPSAAQLYRSMQRKNKPIAIEDALSVAAVHQMVTDQTWACIMEYEQLHADTCGAPTLARFEGKDGIWSPKARLLNLFGVNMPFDRHDWYVDRCGKEVRYVIDYYASGSDHMEYHIDARPAGLGGLLDRVRVAWRTWRNPAPAPAPDAFALAHGVESSSSGSGSEKGEGGAVGGQESKTA